MGVDAPTSKNHPTRFPAQRTDPAKFWAKRSEEPLTCLFGTLDGKLVMSGKTLVAARLAAGHSGPGRIELALQPADGLIQRREVVGDCVFDLRMQGVEISVGYQVAEANDLSPRHIGLGGSDLGGEVLDRFADDEQLHPHCGEGATIDQISGAGVVADGRKSPPGCQPVAAAVLDSQGDGFIEHPVADSGSKRARRRHIDAGT